MSGIGSRSRRSSVRALPIIAATPGVVACGADDRATATTAFVIDIDAPAGAIAGEAITLTISTDGDGPFDLVVSDALAATTIEVDVAGGIAEIDIPPRLTTLSGALRIDSGESTATVIVSPSQVAAIDVAVGPTTITADGEDSTMGLALPTDAFGNPLADGTEIDLLTIDGGAVSLEAEAAVRSGVATTAIRSDFDAGAVELFARSGSVTSSPSASIQLEAGASKLRR